jgi:uncharacterized membrane protein YqhA
MIATSAIRVLEEFVNVRHVINREMAWLIGIHMAFVISGLLFAPMN